VRSSAAKTPQAYNHKDKEVLLRPDVGLQAQFKQRKPPVTYRYDPSLDPQLSWDINADRERAEALIRQIQEAKTLEEAKAAAVALARMSRPFLDWAGKAERAEFSVPTLPLFVHERLSTKAILETLKGRKRDKQMSLSLFGDEELDLTDRVLKAYEHKAPWVNRMILGDSLVVMNSLLQYEGLGGQVQMIYMDPPYGVKFGSNFQPFIRRRDVKHNDDEDLTREPEMVQAYRDTWELGLHSYLTYLRDRLLLCRELLHPSGSIFVQISDENLHHVREVLDEVFGAENFVSQVAFSTTAGRQSDFLDGVYDVLFWYAKDISQAKYRQLFLPKEPGEAKGEKYSYVEFPDRTVKTLAEASEDPTFEASAVRFFAVGDLTSQGHSESGVFPVEIEGRKYFPGRGRHWSCTEDGIVRLKDLGRIIPTGERLMYKRYLDDFPAFPLTNVWTDTSSGASRRDPKLYVVQTRPIVVQRCLLMTTDPGDLVLDPTCGSGTTAYVAEQWGRRWITIDTSRVPLALARQRLLTTTFPYYELREPDKSPSAGFVYKRRQNSKGEEAGGIVPHVTLKSIAQNEPPQEEILVDRLEVVPGIVRVTGTFVVEATIPTPIEVEAAPRVQEPPAPDYEADPIARMIEVLRRSPVLRLPNNQIITFKNIRRPARAMDLHAEGVVANGEEKPMAFVFGPEHGAVTEQMVFAAAREAYAKSYSHLYVIGFAIQANASKLIQNCEQVVGIPATYVQATMDIQMGDLLKTTRASQVFSVTGAPEVRLMRLRSSGLYQVELLGLDVFDPVTMEVDHRRGDDVPAWFLDTDYNELAFCVSQAFFPRTSAWDNLKRALKGVYEDSVWEHLAGTVSEPFAAGEHRRIAIKVIDDRGNELMVVKSLDEAEEA
jgi:adenine-specific DNA-methyltransferase